MNELHYRRDIAEPVLVVAPHPDDEVIGAGGVIASGGVQVLMLCHPHTKGRPDGERQTRSMFAMDRVAAAFGARYHLAGFVDEQMTLAQAVDAIEAAIAVVDPRTVIAPWRGDMNQDHQTAAAATVIAARLSRSSRIEALLAMEVPSSSDAGYEPPPEIGGLFREFEWASKAAMLSWYRHELAASDRRLEVIEALATVRGAVIGVRAAELFQVVRMAVRAE